MNLTLFDLDGTLIETDSDHAFGRFMIEVGWAEAGEWARQNDHFYRQYLDGCLDLPAYVRFATSAWRNRPPDQALAMRERYLREVIEPAITPQARDLVRRHQEAGDRVAIVTATNAFVTTPIARAFGVDTLIAVDLATDAHGRVTGEVQGTPSFREGKIVRVRQWLAAQGQRLEDFGRSTFYSDSTNDLPLLEQVSHPVATNPSPALEALARERGWPVLRLFT